MRDKEPSEKATKMISPKTRGPSSVVKDSKECKWGPVNLVQNMPCQKLNSTNKLLLHSWFKKGLINSLYNYMGKHVVPCYSCIKSLDVNGPHQSKCIQRFDSTVARYYSCTVA